MGLGLLSVRVGDEFYIVHVILVILMLILMLIIGVGKLTKKRDRL